MRADRESKDQSEGDKIPLDPAALAISLADALHQRASRPLHNMLLYVELNLMRLALNFERLIPQKRYQKIVRQVAKRDVGRFKDLATRASGRKHNRDSGDAMRSEEYVPYSEIASQSSGGARAIAFYLPQFHPFPENDAWWGKGFTEWTNVGKAKPLFENHYQPHCPIHLGYYDLRIPEILVEQARLARLYGVAGFSYYFYWFDGKTLMEAPLRSMLERPEVDIPFCLTWANENWTRRWDGKNSEILIEQKYSLESGERLIQHLAEYFRDPRYIRVGNRPVFNVYRPSRIPDVRQVVQAWRSEAQKLGFEDLYLMGIQGAAYEDFTDFGFDASVEFPPHGFEVADLSAAIRTNREDFAGRIIDYQSMVDEALNRPQRPFKVFRGATMGWDNTARRPSTAQICINYSVASFRDWISHLKSQAESAPDRHPDENFVFINAWNEWAEGTHLEPDQRYGFANLEAVRSVFAAR